MAYSEDSTGGGGSKTGQASNILAFSGGITALGEALRQGQTLDAGQQFEPVGALDDPTPADLERQRRMAHAWKAYEGKLPAALPRGRSAQKTPDANAPSNRCKPIVKTGAAFLVGKDLTLTIEAEEEGETSPDEGEVKTGNQEAQDFLDDFAEANQLMTLLGKTAINGGVFGHAFLKLVPYKDASRPPRLLLVNSQQMRVETDPDDTTTVLAYVNQYRSALRVIDGRTGKVTEKPIDKRQVIERMYDAENGETPQDCTCWRITDQQRVAGTDGSAVAAAPVIAGNASVGGGWQTVAQTDWPYSWPPIFDCQNLPNGNEYWGEEDITPDLIELNALLNRAQSNGQKILDWWASPKLWVKGLAEGSQIEADPSRATKLPVNGEIGVVQPISDLSALLNFLAMLRANMDEQSCVPAVALGRQSELPKGNLSGIALELLFQPLLQQTESKRRTYGEMLEYLCQCVLEYAGFGSGVSIEIGWPDVLPKDPSAQWQVAAQMHDAGVSYHTILTDAGYDADSEMQRSLQEKQDSIGLQQQMFSRGQGLPSFPPTSRGLPPQGPPQNQPPQPPQPPAPDDNEEENAA